MTKPQKQDKNSYLWLRASQFKPGQSGNPGGRPKGTISLKEYAKTKLLEMNEKEKEEFITGIDKDKIWEMAEGKAKQDIDMQAEVTTKILSIDE